MSLPFRQQVNGNELQCIDNPMPASYWVRNKKLSINLQDNPFAVDRQLSDQRYMIEKNRNPRLSEPTKVDKPRSEQLIAKKGSSRPVAIKANVLNKIVREASNVHSYVIIPPPKVNDPNKNKNDDDDIDPETHPRFRIYAKEANKKPTVMSFGHRPRSASRVFHPATMRIKLKHGEIAHTNSVSKTATGFGLPVAILSQVIKAPHISGDIMDVNDSNDNYNNNNKNDSTIIADPYNLFGPSSPVTMKNNDSYDEATWVSNIDNESSLSQSLPLRGNNRKQQRKKSEKLEPLHDKPWDEGFHTIRKSNKDLVSEKTIGRAKEPLTLLERMHRYETMSVEEAKLSMFCVEKQINDIEQIKGKIIEPKKPGKDSYYDPRNPQLQIVKANRIQMEIHQSEKRKSKMYQDALATIPIVSYNPVNSLKAMSKKSGKFAHQVFSSSIDWTKEENWPKNSDEFQMALVSAIEEDDSIPLVSYMINWNKEVDINHNSSWPSNEEFSKAYFKAKKGDRRALFDNYLMRDFDGGMVKKAQEAAFAVMSTILSSKKEDRETREKTSAEPTLLSQRTKELGEEDAVTTTNINSIRSMSAKLVDTLVDRAILNSR